LDAPADSTRAIPDWFEKSNGREVIDHLNCRAAANWKRATLALQTLVGHLESRLALAIARLGEPSAIGNIHAQSCRTEVWLLDAPITSSLQQQQAVSQQNVPMCTFVRSRGGPSLNGRLTEHAYHQKMGADRRQDKLRVRFSPFFSRTEAMAPGPPDG
jgi:hypothetical protein